MPRNYTVDENQNEHGEKEEKTNGPDKVKLLPECVGFGQTAGLRRTHYSLPIAYDE